MKPTAAACGGQALVEMALAIPMLFLLLWGILQLGELLRTMIRVQEIAYDAGRAASLGQNPDLTVAIRAAALKTKLKTPGVPRFVQTEVQPLPETLPYNGVELWNPPVEKTALRLRWVYPLGLFETFFHRWMTLEGRVYLVREEFAEEKS